MPQQNQALMPEATTTENPFFEDWTGAFGAPPFGRIRPEHFRPAFARAFAEHEAEVAAIAADPAEPTFANTIEALELSGEALTRVDDVFHALSGAHTNDAILEIERDMAGKHVVTLSRSSVEPFLQFSARRDLREKIFRAWIARGDGDGETDNKAMIAETVALRAERARLLGYPTFAHYRLDDAMAKTPEAARSLLDRVWTPARSRALADRDDMQAIVQAEGGNFELAAWDWRYYAGKLRKARCDVDEAT